MYDFYPEKVIESPTRHPKRRFHATMVKANSLKHSTRVSINIGPYATFANPSDSSSRRCGCGRSGRTTSTTILKSSLRTLSAATTAALARGWAWNPALLHPDIDERTHGFDILVSEHAKETAYVDKVDEACVELLVST